MVAVDKVLSANGAGGGILHRRAGYPMSSILFNSMRSKTLMPAGCDSINTFSYDQHARKMLNANMDDEAITKTVVGVLKEVLPQMPKEILFSKIQRWLEGVYQMPPGSATALKNMRDHHYRDVEGLYLCGEYLYTGSYESALASGRAAAQAAMGERESI